MPANCPATPAQRLTGLLAAVALLLLLLTPVLVSAAPMPVAQHAGSMMAHDHHPDQSSDAGHSCWQQCLSSCTSHCAPQLALLPLVPTAGTLHTPLPPDLYRPLFASGLHRPPKA